MFCCCFKKRRSSDARLPLFIVPQIVFNQETVSVHNNYNDISDDSGINSPNNINVSEPSTPLSLSKDYSLAKLTTDDENPDWIQVSGHKKSFIKIKNENMDVILKTYCEIENYCYKQIHNEMDLSPFVPIFHGLIQDSETNKYLKMEDLLAGYNFPEVMDCKMGCRTYLQEELNAIGVQFRHDLYLKMISVDPNEPTAEEHERKAILKTRYMTFRESLSSTTNLGFRVDGMKKSNAQKKKFPTEKTFEQVRDIFAEFTDLCPSLISCYLEQITELRAVLVDSAFFMSHEVVGSSLLFVHGTGKPGIVRMIDFARVQSVKSGPMSHSVWGDAGTQEDGYLIGMDNIICILKSLLK